MDECFLLKAWFKGSDQWMFVTSSSRSTKTLNFSFVNPSHENRIPSSLDICRFVVNL